MTTQVIIREIVKRQRNATALYFLKSGKSGYINVYCADVKNPNIRLAYSRITSAKSEFWKFPSFTASTLTYSKIPTYTLKATYKEAANKCTYGSLTLTDNNKVLSNFKSLAGTYNVGNATVKATVSGNTLKLACSNVIISARYNRNNKSEKDVNTANLEQRADSHCQYFRAAKSLIHSARFISVLYLL